MSTGQSASRMSEVRTGQSCLTGAGVACGAPAPTPKNQVSRVIFRLALYLYAQVDRGLKVLLLRFPLLFWLRSSVAVAVLVRVAVGPPQGDLEKQAVSARAPAAAEYPAKDPRSR